MVDEFIFYDDVQYTKNDWRNRNKIKTKDGVMWLTIPCGKNLNRLINEVKIESSFWQKKHWKSIVANYEKARHFKLYQDFFKEFYLVNIWKNLSELNQYLIKNIAKNFLNINTKFNNSENYNLTGKKNERLIDLLKKVNASKYISGSSAKNYLDLKLFEKEGIEVTWVDYSGYSEYKQLYGGFENQVSIIDLLFNEGPNLTRYMKSFYHK